MSLSKGCMQKIMAQLDSKDMMQQQACAAGTVEMPSSSLQEDGTLEDVLQHRDLLTKVLDALCGTRGPKDADDSVRQALAEAVLMLVSCCRRAHARGLESTAAITPAEHKHVLLAPKAGLLLKDACTAMCCALPISSRCGTRELTIWAVLPLQAGSAAGRKALWDLKAPELLKTG